MRKDKIDTTTRGCSQRDGLQSLLKVFEGHNKDLQAKVGVQRRTRRNEKHRVHICHTKHTIFACQCFHHIF